MAMRNYYQESQNVMHGLDNAPVARISALYGGYANPAHQLAKNNTRLALKSPQVQKLEGLKMPSTAGIKAKGCVTNMCKLNKFREDGMLSKLL